MQYPDRVKRLEEERQRQKERELVREYADRAQAPGAALADTVTAKNMVAWYEEKYGCNWEKERGIGI